MARSEAPFHIEHIAGSIDEAIKETLKYRPDLIIEGATNNHDALLSLFRSHYKGAYVGMDINPDIDYEASRFTIYGNCLNVRHVRKVVLSHEAQRPAFVTFNGLNAIISNKIGPWDNKDGKDQFSNEQAVENITRLYGIQMHVVYGGFFNELKYFYNLCVESGWHVKEIGRGKQLMVLTRDSGT